jgi:6-phosphogluconolactonase
MRSLFCLIALLILPIVANAQTSESYRVYLGTYTGKMSKGIYQTELNLKDGSLAKPTLAGETKDPSFLAIHPNQKFLYACNEGQESVSAFAIDAQTGALTFLNSQPSQGGLPCHVTVDPTGKNLLAANYGGGSCICFPVGDDGKLGKVSSFQQHMGKKKNGHAIHVDKANKFAFCCDLGLDKVIIYAFDPAKGTLTPHGEFNTPKGAGPRHFAWHPDGKHTYVNGESDLTVITCTYDADKGTLTQKQVLSTLPKDVKRKGGSTAETVVHPSGKFVYVSNRDPYNSIAIFSVDAKTRELTPVGHFSKDVKTPRNFAIEPTGQYMLIANQSGNSVFTCRINQETGELTQIAGTTIEVGAPVCVRFMPK